MINYFRYNQVNEFYSPEESSSKPYETPKKSDAESWFETEEGKRALAEASKVNNRFRKIFDKARNPSRDFLDWKPTI
mgnify:CR=1 FL=1